MLKREYDLLLNIDLAISVALNLLVEDATQPQICRIINNLPVPSNENHPRSRGIDDFVLVTDTFQKTLALLMAARKELFSLGIFYATEVKLEDDQQES